MLHIQKQMLNLLISALLVSPLAPLSAQSAPVCLTGELGALRQDLGSEEQVLLRQGSEEQALLRQGYEEQVLLRQGYEEQAGDSDGAVMSAQPAYTDPNFHYAGPVGAQLGTSTRSGSRTFDIVGANSLTQLEQLEAQNERAAASVVSPAFYDIGIKPTDLSDVNTSAMYTISRHGRYYLSQDILANTTVSSTAIPAIKITTSNVVLDLNQATITRYGSNTKINIGIEIAASQSNITIQNGRISNLAGDTDCNGIKVGSGCSNLVFKNLTIADIQGTTGSGISTAATCSNLVFQDLIVSGCKNNIVLSTSNSVLIRNVQCVNATGGGGVGLTISNGSNVVVLDSIFSFNGGTAAIGV
ncbi:MAG TPA: right-handed parallel beta-helix repeat-containing protein, partial [Candidatus Babeliales bacterium]|nr:right-handed parallel beta-helix repeat-containing protein [Candidatus Babeliales bacterium]